MTLENGKVALVTGGSSGIGLAVTKMLLSKGVKVFVASQDASGREEIALALENLDQPLTIEWDIKKIDITIWEHQVEAFHTVISKWGRVDYVFANAGVGERVWLPTVTPADGGFSKPDLSALDVNLTGTMYTTALAIQQFRRQNENDFGFKGKLFITASICGFYSIPTLPTYTAAKHALVGFTRTYSRMVEGENITINGICPNIVRTNISSSSFYDQMEAKKLLTPMETLLGQFEELMGVNKQTGSIIECGPGGAMARRQDQGYMDRESEEC